MSIKLSELLPAPSSSADAVRRDPWFRGKESAFPDLVVATKEPPRYGQRTAWRPKSVEDFGDGGAFPEIHMAQFPMGMGQGGKKGNSSNTLALQTDVQGKVRFDAIAKQGHDKDRIVYSRLSDTKSRALEEEDMPLRPTTEELVEETERTREALEKITKGKISSALPVQHAEKQAPAQYIRYTPSQQGVAHAGGAQQRIIRMVETQVDPMEPPKFKINQKIPRAPPSPPPPILHSPPRRMSVKEQNDWKIPPCISNWKNPKGFTVALDKRLAADGRGLQQQHINENFAKLSEALYIADRKAREAVETRAQLEKRVAQQKKEEQEENMRRMAAKAREDRSKLGRGGEKDEGAKEREAIRRDRLDDIRKERNVARSRPDKADKLQRERDRDISEKIVLGLPDAKVRSTDTQFDQRLFDSSQGLDSGGIDDETYNAYDKPWRPQDNIQQHIYRPSKNADKDVYGDDLERIVNTNRFVPDKGFSGADPSHSRQSGPVQFERADEDVFGLTDLLQDVKGGRKRGGEGEGESSKRSRRD